MFVKFLLDFYIQYFIIVLVLFIVTWHLSASFIRALALLMLGILFPVADIFIPSLWFSSYCKANLKYVDKGPIRNVRGYYAEDSDGLCSVECQPSTFIRGYEYVEGRINKKRKKHQCIIVILLILILQLKMLMEVYIGLVWLS